ncbi:MAG: hypothetical protein AAF611_16510 [Bacteroidota bacterium]
MNQRIIYLIATLSLLVMSCSKTSFETEQELLDYIQDEANGYIQKKTIKDVDFSLLYKPTDLLVSKDIQGAKEAVNVTALRDQYDNYLYFNLSISHNNQELLNTIPKNRHEFGQMVQQLSFGMRDKITLHTKSKETIEMMDFVYPRMYGMSSATTILLVYPRDEEKLKEEFLYLKIKDLGIGTGEVKFKIPTEILYQQPIVTFEN